MPVDLLIVLSLVTGVACLAVAWASVRSPDASRLSYIQHFTAGVVIAVISAEVIPEIERQLASPAAVLGGFIAGGLTMLAVNRLADRDAPAESASVFPFVAATGVDVLVDGLTVGAGFSAAERVGLLLALSLGLEVVFAALAVEGALRVRGASAWRASLAALGLALLLPLGAGLGLLFFKGASATTVQAVLAFGAAALVYLISEELMTEAHRAPEPRAAAMLVFAGFLAVFAFALFGTGP